MKAIALRSMAMVALSIGAFVSTTGVCSAVEWNFATVLPESNFQLQNAREFAQAVSQATNGEVTIKVHPGGSLGYRGPDLVAAVQDGLVEIADIQMNQQTGEDPLFGIESLPFLASNYEELRTLQKITRPYFDEAAKKFNQKILYITPWPPQSLYSNYQVKNDISEFSDVIVRTIDMNATDFFTKLGAAAVQMPWGEVMPALATGALNGVSTAPTSAVDGKFWEIIKYNNDLQWQMNSQMVTVNLDVWHALKAEHQALIEEKAKELSIKFWERSVEENTASIALLAEKGMIAVSPSTELMQQLREVAKPMWDSAASSDTRAKKILDEYQNALAEEQ